MRATLSLIRKELSAYFFSPTSYIILAVFTIVTGYLFTQVLEQLTASGPQGVQYPMQMLMGVHDFESRKGTLSFLAFWVVFLVLPPLLTMRLLAEEKSSGTLETLLTSPLRDWQIILAKYVACFLFYVVLWLPTLAYVPVLVNLDWTTGQAAIDPWPILTSYIGIASVGAMFLAIGLFVSSMVQSQLLAVLLSLFLNLLFVGAGLLQPTLQIGSTLYQVIFFFAVPLHFERNFTRGVLSTRQLVLYGSVAMLFLLFTVRSLESRRWR